jgi:transposase
MALTWYGNQSSAEGCNLGPLALIYPMLERMKVAEIIDRHIPADPQAEYSYGTVLSLLAAARLYSPVALLGVADWAADSGADILWNIPTEKLNDDRLARALEAFFPQRHSILANVALHVAREFDIPLSEIHYDPTHILFHGACKLAQPRVGVLEGGQVRSDAQLSPAHITKGRGTDDAPDGALMIHTGLNTFVDEFGPLPFFAHTVDGNQNGHTAVAENLALMRKHLPFQQITMISDRGTFSAGHLLRLWNADDRDKTKHSYALCAAPWAVVQELFDQKRAQLKFSRASYLSREQQRRRECDSDLPREHYDLAVTGHTFTDEDSGKTIKCRVIFVFSTADQKVVRQQRQKQIDKLRAGLEQIQQSVAAGNRSTDERGVTRRVARLFGTKQAAKYFDWKMVPLTKQERAALPTPARGKKRPTHRFVFTFNAQAVQADEQYDGYSALVTTVPLNQASGDQLFRKYKEQIYSEHVNRQFKGPLAVHPLYLHTPERIEALVFLLALTLMLYFLLQRLYRQSVPAKAPLKEHRVTAQQLLQAFSSYTLLVHYTRLGREVQPTRLTTRQRELLQRLGFPTPAQILSRILPRPPT